MARFLKDRTKAKGKAPGSLVFIGRQKMESSIIQLIQYNPDSIYESEVTQITEAFNAIKDKHVNWINIYGLHDLEIIKYLGEFMQLPSLLLEDMLNTDQQPKYHDGNDYDAFILKMLHQDTETNHILAEQITIVLGKNCIVTLQEKKGDVFASVRERIRKSTGRIRSKQNDYLAYSLMDTIVDNYMILIEGLGTKVEEMEDRIFLKKDTKILEEIYSFKTELNYLRKNVRPVREAITKLLRTDTSGFQKKNIQYLKDLHELVVQSTDAIELYNSLVSDQLNIYNTSVGNAMNEVMKTLTIFASIFIPLTFLAGIYGMNFEYIPELKFKYAYAIFWGIIIVIGVILLIYFKRKKWL